MAAAARSMASPGDVLTEAGDFLASDPIRHNVIVTLLRGRAAWPEPGRYWVVDVDGSTAGVVFQSPLHFVATVTPMAAAAVTTAVERIVDDGVRLPGVTGEAATAARFAGHWAEVTKLPVRPVEGQRIYELDRVRPPQGVPGTLRPAGRADADLMTGWLQAFHDEVGDGAGNAAAAAVERRLDDRRLWIWDDGGPAAMAGVSEPVAGVVRIGPVYTPPARRNRGYASALVAALSAAAAARGERCMLYTELSNPTSNSIYRAVGYRAVTEVLGYRFGDGV